MLGRIVTKLAVYLLKRVDISLEDRALLTHSVLDRLVAIPIGDSIRYNEEGKLFVNNHQVDAETARVLRESAKGAVSSLAFKTVRESVNYQAFAIAATKAEKTEDLIFGKAAIWYGQEMLKVLKALAGDETEPPL